MAANIVGQLLLIVVNFTRTQLHQFIKQCPSKCYLHTRLMQTRQLATLYALFILAVLSVLHVALLSKPQ